MNSPAASTSALPAVDHETDKISAYYSLAFPNFTYYLQTLTVTIGRRPIPSTSSSEASYVDVDLGPLKSVSRLHARIEYEDDEERFVLVVLGRNGAWVDGIWAASGSRVPLGARSQIQIATRTFHFVLPPPPAPESMSLSSPPSTARQRSPSVDITSLSPGSSYPASPRSKALTISVPDTHVSAVSKPAKSSKKRKKPDSDQPMPENMPPKPQVTYAVMCYRAITSLGGKATLQEVVQWMIDNYEWYRLNIGGPWENSIRHNLSSNRAFRNAERSLLERGKGFMWCLDPKFEQGLQEQDAKARQVEATQQQARAEAPSVPESLPKYPQPPKPVFTKQPSTKSGNVKKEKNAANLPPVFTKSPKSAINGAASPHTLIPTGPAPGHASEVPISLDPASSLASGSTSAVPTPSTSSNLSNATQIPSNVCLPIIVGSLPESHPAASASAEALASSPSPASALLTTPPIVLHAGKLILNPTIFSHLTPKHLKELEGLGAQKALEILQGYIVRFLKERMKSEGGGRGRSRGRGRGGRGSTAGRGGNKGRGKEVGASTSEIGVNGTKLLSSSAETKSPMDAESGPLSADATAENPSPTVSSPQAHSTQLNGARTRANSEEPVRKKRKLDNVSTVDGGEYVDMDADVDVVGT